MGSLTYNTWRGISIVKSRVGPTTQYSAAQIAIRAKTAAATASWQGLTDAQRAPWEDYSIAHTDIDWTGSPQRITAYNWYIRINVRRQNLGLGIRVEPPDVAPDARVITLTATPGFEQIQIQWTMTPWDPVAELFFEIYGCGPHSAGTRPTIKQCRRLHFAPGFITTWWWSTPDPGLYTIFGRPVHIQGVTCGWKKTTGSPT